MKECVRPRIARAAGGPHAEVLSWRSGGRREARSCRARWSRQVKPGAPPSVPAGGRGRHPQGGDAIRRSNRSSGGVWPICASAARSLGGMIARGRTVNAVPDVMRRGRLHNMSGALGRFVAGRRGRGAVDRSAANRSSGERAEVDAIAVGRGPSPPTIASDRRGAFRTPPFTESVFDEHADAARARLWTPPSRADNMFGMAADDRRPRQGRGLPGDAPISRGFLSSRRTILRASFSRVAAHGVSS